MILFVAKCLSYVEQKAKLTSSLQDRLTTLFLLFLTKLASDTARKLLFFFFLLGNYLSFVTFVTERDFSTSQYGSSVIMFKKAS